LYLFVEPISKNTGMYVPAYPLPILEIASFVKSNLPDVEIKVISLPMDYGLPLTSEGKEEIFREFLKDFSQLKPRGVGISCTAISQAEEVIHLCDLIRAQDPTVFIFLGGYFPTLYYEEIFSRSTSVDLIVKGEGEIPSLKILELLEKGESPLNDKVPNLVWKKDDHIHHTRSGMRFDLEDKALLNLELLRQPGAYDILPYAFSRGCSFRCNFCMEEYIRPYRRKVPLKTIHDDMKKLISKSKTQTLFISDALFKSFDLFPLLRSLGVKIDFETRCDILDPALIPSIADICGLFAIGFESASYRTLRRMNKVRSRSHYQRYISNARAIFKQAASNKIPMIIFMIAGYPGDTKEDLEESLAFAQELSKNRGPGGHVFKIGECHAYPRTKTYDLAVSLKDVVFDDDGVFGQNVVRQSSKDLNFKAILNYTKEIFNLSYYTPKIQEALLNIMPFFRLPAKAFTDDTIPAKCFRNNHRTIFNVHGQSLSIFRGLAPDLSAKYKDLMSGQRSVRILDY